MPSTPLLSLLAFTLVVAIATDLKARRIPDLLTYPAMAAALLLRLYEGGLGADWTQGALSGVLGGLGAALWFGAFARFSKGLGWGDVKLAAAVGAVLGVPLMLTAVVLISVVGAAQAGVQVLWQGKKERGASIPYAVAIALGTLWAIWWQP